MRSASNSASGRGSVVRYPQAVRDLVADLLQFGRGEIARELSGGHLVEAQRMAGIEDVGEGDFLPPRHRLDLDAVILDQQRQLFGQIFGEERGLGDADAIIAGRYQPPERAHRGGAPVVSGGVTPLVGQPDLRIGEAAVEAHRRIGAGAVAQIGGQRGLEAFDRGAVEAVEFGDDGGGGCHPGQLRPGRYGGKTRGGTLPLPAGRGRRPAIRAVRADSPPS